MHTVTFTKPSILQVQFHKFKTEMSSISNDQLLALLSSMATGADHPEGKPKSGENRTAADTVKVHVAWPHEVIYAENGQPITPDNITLSQFVRGLITLIEIAPEDEQKYMLKYLRECMLDCERFGWEHVRQFNVSFFHGLEQQKYTWKDTRKIDFERLLFKPYYPPSRAEDSDYGFE